MRTWTYTLKTWGGNNPAPFLKGVDVMKLYDMESNKAYTLPELFRDWKTFRKEEPWNHAETFKTEWFEILMATVNGRNDCDVIGPTATELDRYIRRLRKAVEYREH